MQLDLDPRLEELRKNLHNRDWLDGGDLILKRILDTLAMLIEDRNENAAH